MNAARAGAAAGPSWRAPAPRPAPAERTFVACRCGVDMEFVWPPERASVRCFGCGAGFARPLHLPPPEPPPGWRPEASRPRARATRALRRHWALVALSLVALALLVGGVALGLQ